jgi:TonB family protein
MRLTLALLLCLTTFAPRAPKAQETAPARPAQEQGRASSKDAPAPQAPEVERLNAQVVALSKEGKYAEALPLAARVLELREKELGNRHPLVGVALLNLAAVNRNLGKLEEAKGFYQRAVAVAEKGGDESAKLLINALDGLIRLESYLPRLVELNARSLALKEKAYGPDSPQVSATLFQLGHFNELSGNYDEAERFFKRFIEVTERSKAGAEDDVAVAYMRLGCLAGRKDKMEEAATNRAHALEVFSRVAGKRGAPVEGGIVNGKALSKPQPAYPAVAKRANAQGTIAVQILVGETGSVLAACAQGEGHPALKQSSEFAAYGARFTPTTINGKPAKVTGIITYRFVLSQ